MKLIWKIDDCGDYISSGESTVYRIVPNKSNPGGRLDFVNNCDRVWTHIMGGSMSLDSVKEAAQIHEDGGFELFVEVLVESEHTPEGIN